MEKNIKSNQSFEPASNPRNQSLWSHPDKQDINMCLYLSIIGRRFKRPRRNVNIQNVQFRSRCNNFSAMFHIFLCYILQFNDQYHLNATIIKVEVDGIMNKRVRPNCIPV